MDTQPTQHPPAEEPQEGQTFAGGAHFFQGILNHEGTRWLIYLSAEERERYLLGDLSCIKLRPKPGETPRIFGNELLFTRRVFYRDPVIIWDDQDPPKSLVTYLKSDKFRRVVRTEDDITTEVRARLERLDGETRVRRDQFRISEIPPEQWPLAKELMKTMSSVDVAKALSTPERVITYGAVDRLKKHLIRIGEWQRQEVQIRNQIAADEEDCETKLAHASHLMELSDEAIASHCPNESENLRKNAHEHFEMAKFLQKRVDAGYRKLEDVEAGRQTEERKGTQDQLAALQRKVEELEAQVAALKQAPSTTQPVETSTPPPAEEEVEVEHGAAESQGTCIPPPAAGVGATSTEAPAAGENGGTPSRGRFDDSRVYKDITPSGRRFMDQDD